MNKLARIIVILTVLLVAWHFWTRNAVDSQDGLRLDFQFDPTERFDLDSKHSWIVTVIVIVVASGLIAI